MFYFNLQSFKSRGAAQKGGCIPGHSGLKDKGQKKKKEKKGEEIERINHNSIHNRRLFRMMYNLFVGLNLSILNQICRSLAWTVGTHPYNFIAYAFEDLKERSGVIFCGW